MLGWKSCSSADVAVRRSEMLTRIRHYFAAENVLEVDTPALSRSAVSDAQIESLEVRSNLTSSPLYLHTSPEFFMKRLLADGYPDIFSICRVFRDGELGRSHQPEFTMLEWYRHKLLLPQIINDTVCVIATALQKRELTETVAVVDYEAAFETATGTNPFSASIDELAKIATNDQTLRRSIGDARNDWLDLLLTTSVIPAFATNCLTVLRRYPATQAALAALTPGSDRTAERFEVFWGSTELANGYVELTDRAEQQCRFERDQAERESRGLKLRPLDQQLLAALQNGMPPCAGVAMGIERLHMVLEGTDRITDVVTFAFENDDE